MNITFANRTSLLAIQGVMTSAGERPRSVNLFGRSQKGNLIVKNMSRGAALQPKGRLIRYMLGGLLLLVAINAFAGGYYGMSGAINVPVDWLKGSPFHNYFVPGLVLFVIVGGSALFAAITVFRRQLVARTAAFVSVTIILFWLVVQVAVIGYVSWMQPTTAVTTLIILFLTGQLPKHDR